MEKKNQYASTSLNEYLNESRAFMLKRGYGDKKPVIVGAKANVRDQVLPFVAESRRVSKRDLVSFITGLNEGTKRSAVNMWIKRNGQFFITESKGGKTFFKLSKLGERLMKRVSPMMEAKKAKVEEPVKKKEPKTKKEELNKEEKKPMVTEDVKKSESKPKEEIKEVEK